MTIPSPSKSRVLIVDDEATIRQFMIEVLSRFDFSPVPASDAAEALQILDRETIDLVLLDLHMPGPADGEDLLYLLRDRGDDIPIIIVSGWVDDDATREQPDCVHAVLKKPVAVETLLSTIRRVLEAACGRRVSDFRPVAAPAAVAHSRPAPTTFPPPRHAQLPGQSVAACHCEAVPARGHGPPCHLPAPLTS